MNSADRAIQRWRFSVAAPSIPADSRILDIGAHHGDLFEYLGDRIAPSVGIDDEIASDTSAGRHELLAGRFPDRMPDGVFDAATLLAVVEHLDEALLDRCATGLLSVLRPRGVVVVTMPSPRADGLLCLMCRARLIEGMDLDAHHGVTTDAVVTSWCGAGMILRTRRRFEMGCNNLLVFAVPDGRPR